LPKPLPEDYVAFLQRANGGEGFVGERYVRLWKAEELIEVNRGYNVAEFFPNLFLIGTDGGGEAYAFDFSGNDATVFEYRAAAFFPVVSCANPSSDAGSASTPARW
jgi:hypothetical protein